ncbi:MAG: AAA family ATPase, partial [Solobacterium sp.]|nr:AAA family ATPase [Solobacterium sp.]
NISVATAEGPTKIQLLVEQHKKNLLIFDQTKSSGTAALELLFYWSRRFKDLSFLFIDEFDAFYHFELARNVLMYVAGIDNLQSIFTTHNSYLASNNLLRPDCYFMLSNGELKSFADSTDRELREGHNLEKMLRNGEFDAK